ncbi:MAG: HD domain-containing phosphohydrolase, partial [bacterium]|nr:HD domain-containing phosphohydrolase [bacterium]
EEYAKIQAHVLFTKEILKRIHFPRQLRNIPELASAHHEKVNGQGYPDGLQGDNLNIEARILAVADVFDALTAYDRPYKKAMPLEKSLSIIQSEVGEAFDPEVVRVFVEKKCYLIEQREFNRLTADVSIEYRVLMEEEALEREEKIHQESAATMSGSGLSIKSKKYVPPGKLMEMKLIIPGAVIEVMGRVARVDRDELGMQYDMGIEFLGLPEDVKNRLARYLELNVTR